MGTDRFDEAQNSHGLNGADASNPRKDTGKPNRAEERHTTTKQNKQMEIPKRSRRNTMSKNWCLTQKKKKTTETQKLRMKIPKRA